MANPLTMLASIFGSAAAGQASGSVISPLTNVTSYGANYMMPTAMPTPEQALASYYTGFMGLEKLNMLYLMNGRELGAKTATFSETKFLDNRAVLNEKFTEHATNTWESIARSVIYTPTSDEVLTMLNRRVISADLGERWLSRNAGGQRAIARAVEQLRFQIPGPSDLVRFALREAFDPVVVAQYGYNKEFPVGILPWMDKQGFGSSLGFNLPPGTTDQAGNPIVGETYWSHLFWFSHWDIPSPTQGYEMLHRLYPSSPFGPSPDLGDTGGFEEQDMETLLRVSDYPEYWRKKLIAISYHPITRTDASWLYENQLMKADMFYHTLRSLGYNDRNAQLYLQGEELKRRRSMRVDPGKTSKDWICNHYKYGILTDNKAKELIKNNGYDDDEAERFLEVCKLELQTETVKEQVKHLRIAFLRGILSEQDLQLQLLDVMSNQSVRQEMLKRWKLQREVKYKTASARQNITFFKNRIIDESVLERRLFNLGYDAVTVSNIIINAKAEIIRMATVSAQKQARELAKSILATQKEALQTAKEKAKEQAKQQKKSEGFYKKKVAGLIKASTDKYILDFYEKGVITLPDVYYRLYHRDFSIADAERWVQTKLPNTTESERLYGSQKAQAQYRNEPNPPLN